jgi:hypothetical protein
VEQRLAPLEIYISSLAQATGGFADSNTLKCEVTQPLLLYPFLYTSNFIIHTYLIDAKSEKPQFH